MKTTPAKKIILKNDNNVDLVDNSLKQLNITNDPEGKILLENSNSSVVWFQ